MSKVEGQMSPEEQVSNEVLQYVKFSCI
jgi:hypothetical protein